MTNNILTQLFNDKHIDFDTSFKNNVYLNASKTSKLFKKDLSNWRRSKETIAYIDALLRSENITEQELIIVRQGGNAKEQGTWIHEKLKDNFINLSSTIRTNSKHPRTRYFSMKRKAYLYLFQKN
jgi:hypothetical protein